MNTKIYIIGSGGHARPTLEVLNEKYKNSDKEIYDMNFKKNKKEKILGVKVVGGFEKFLKAKKSDTFLAIGDNKLRSKIYNILKKKILRHQI